jgi:hypothetical protein
MVLVVGLPLSLLLVVGPAWLLLLLVVSHHLHTQRNP